jgi:VIT1/CCC1 family predicted Fe2+/Mn2+ transporter
MHTQNVTAQRKVTQQMKATARSAFESVKATISVLRAYFAARLTPVLGDERGEIASWVVVTALVVVAAIAIVGIVVGKLTTTANNIQTP